MINVLSIFGTRPEAIKMAPVIQELNNNPDSIHSVVCVTAQHRHMLDQVLEIFNIEPNYDLNLMKKRQTLTELTARVMLSLEPIFEEVKPDWILVQGDTTTVMAVSLVAFYNDIKVGHVEAGLRTNNKRSPFPEEINRRIASVIADLHFAPTKSSHLSLLAEGIPEKSIKVTGNTVIDALLWVRDIVCQQPPSLPGGLIEKIAGKHLILVTGHRRESFGIEFENICRALRVLAKDNADICIVYPVHLNPNVQEPVYRILGDVDQVELIDPLPYTSFVWLMDQAYLILTDSGGVQEEAPSLGKPVLVMREVTERAEGIAAGNACLVGTDQNKIINKTRELLIDNKLYQQMGSAINPYGDGKAAGRIVDSLLAYK